jgi:hypothetical protein
MAHAGEEFVDSDHRGASDDGDCRHHENSFEHGSLPTHFDTKTPDESGSGKTRELRGRAIGAKWSLVGLVASECPVTATNLAVSNVLNGAGRSGHRYPVWSSRPHDGKTTREQLAELKRLSRAVRCSPSMAPVPISHSRPWPAASRSSNLPRKMPSIVQAGRRRTQRGWTLCTRWPIFSVRRQEISGCLGVCDEFGEPRIL